jgi:hypothetical protein
VVGEENEHCYAAFERPLPRWRLVRYADQLDGLDHIAVDRDDCRVPGLIGHLMAEPMQSRPPGTSARASVTSFAASSLDTRYCCLVGFARRKRVIGWLLGLVCT